MLSISSILWPTDGSEASFEALDAAIEIADKLGARLYALQVVPQVPTVSGAGFGPTTIEAFDIPLYEREMVKMVEKELQEVITRRVGENVEIASYVRIGNPADMINEFVTEKNIGMTVMATHGRTGLSHIMLGSVAEKTIRQATVPTLVIPRSKD